MQNHGKKRKKQSLTTGGKASISTKTEGENWSVRYTAKGVETIEESSIASMQVTVRVSTAKAGETTEASSI